jgi:cytochrome P450
MWTWHLLSQHPNVAAKLVEEVRRVLRGVSP